MCLTEQLTKNFISPEKLNDLPEVSWPVSGSFEIGP